MSYVMETFFIQSKIPLKLANQRNPCRILINLPKSHTLSVANCGKLIVVLCHEFLEKQRF
jgi:hypothetical protein